MHRLSSMYSRYAVLRRVDRFLCREEKNGSDILPPLDIVRDRKPRRKKANAGAASDDPLGGMCALLSSAGCAQSPRRIRPFTMELQKPRESPDDRKDADVILSILDCMPPEQDVAQVLTGSHSSKLRHAVVTRVVLGAGKLQTGVEFFEWAHSTGYRADISAYNAFFQVLIKMGRVDDAYERFTGAEVQAAAPNRSTFTILVEGFASAGNLSKALGMLERGKALGEDCTRACAVFLIRGLCKSGNVIEAWQQFSRWREAFRLELGLYNSLIASFVECGLVDKAMEVRKQMDEDYVKPNEHTYRPLVKGLSDSSRMDEACNVLEEMIRKGYTPDTVTYTMLINGLCRCLQFNRACSYIEQMEAPDIVTYSVVVDSLCTSGKLDHAFGLVEQITERVNKPDAVLYTILIKGLCKAGQVDNALKLLEKMMDIGCPPTARTYNTLFQGLLKAGRAVEARELFSEMIERCCEPDETTYTIICDGFLKKPCLETARRLVIEAKTCSEAACFISTMNRIDELSRSGDMDEAFRAYEDMSEMKQKPPVAVFTSLVRGLVRDANFVGADRLIRDMVSQGCVPDRSFQKAIASGLHLLQGRLQLEVTKVIEEIRENKWTPYPLWSSCLVEALCREGYVEQARHFATEVSKQSPLSNHIWDVLIRELCRHRKAAEALEMLQAATEAGYKVDYTSYQDVIQVLLECGMVQEALSEFKVLLQRGSCGSWPLLMIHSRLMIKLCSTDISQAYDTVQELFRRGLAPTARACNRLLRGLCEAGRFEDAVCVFKQMQEAGSANSATYAILVDEYVRGEKLDEALGAMQEMLQLQMQPLYSSYNELVRALCGAFRVDEGHAVLQQLINIDRVPALATYDALFQAYYGTGRFDRAREVFFEMTKVFRIKGTRIIREEQLRKIGIC